VDHQVEPADVGVEELAVPGHALHQQALDRTQGWVEGLQCAERRDVHRRDGVVGQPALQVEGQGLHLGQLGHLRSLGGTIPAVTR
jgi:hypothetical protein